MVATSDSPERQTLNLIRSIVGHADGHEIAAVGKIRAVLDVDRPRLYEVARGELDTGTDLLLRAIDDERLTSDALGAYVRLLERRPVAAADVPALYALMVTGYVREVRP